MVSLRTNGTLFSRLYIACQARQSNLDSFFEHENQACPPPLISDMGQLRQGSKSDLMECLTKSSQPACIHPGIDSNVLDGAAIVHIAMPGACRTFAEYFQQMFSRISPLSLKLSAEYSIYCRGQVSNRQPETIYKGS